MAKVKTPKKSKQNEATPKSKLSKENIETPDEEELSKSVKKVKVENLTPLSEKSSKKELSEKKNKKNIEISPISKKEKIVLDLDTQNDIQESEELLELSVQLPRLPCYKSALLQLLDTDRPVILKEPLNLVIQYDDRYGALEAMEKLNAITDKSKCVTAKLRHLGQAVPEKRVVYVPKKAPVDEAISVLKKVYGAHMVESKTFANESKMMLLSFGSEEAARAADKIRNKSYHGMELKIGSFFAPMKRRLDEDDKKQNPSKKVKKEEANGDSEIKEEKVASEENNEGIADDDEETVGEAADDNEEEATDVKTQEADDDDEEEQEDDDDEEEDDDE